MHAHCPRVYVSTRGLITPLSIHWLDLPRLRSCACVFFTIHTDWQCYVYFIVVCKSVLCLRVRLCRQPPLGLRALCLGTDVRLSVLITFSFLPSLADLKIHPGGELKVTGIATLDFFKSTVCTLCTRARSASASPARPTLSNPSQGAYLVPLEHRGLLTT